MTKLCHLKLGGPVIMPHRVVSSVDFIAAAYSFTGVYANEDVYANEELWMFSADGFHVAVDWTRAIFR